MTWLACTLVTNTYIMYGSLPTPIEISTKAGTAIIFYGYSIMDCHFRVLNRTCTGSIRHLHICAVPANDLKSIVLINKDGSRQRYGRESTNTLTCHGDSFEENPSRIGWRLVIRVSSLIVHPDVNRACTSCMDIKLRNQKIDSWIDSDVRAIIFSL